MHLGVRSSQNEKEVNKTPAEKSDRGIFLSVKVVSANVRPQLRSTFKRSEGIDVLVVGSGDLVVGQQGLALCTYPPIPALPYRYLNA